MEELNMGIKEALAIEPVDIAAEKEMMWLWEKTSQEIFLTNRVCIDTVEDLHTGILLSRLVDCLTPEQKSCCHILELKGRRWIARTRNEWREDCRMTPRQFDRAIGILQDKKLIETENMKRHGCSVKHISLNWDRLLNLFQKTIDQQNTKGFGK